MRSMRPSTMGMMAAAALAAAALPAVGGSVEVIPRDFGYSPSMLNPRRSAFRQGRRFGYGRGPVAKGGNPAGTKLARKAAQGKLTIVGIR